MRDQKEQDINKLDVRKNIFNRFTQVLVGIILIVILLFVSSGRIGWLYAWIYIVTTLLIITTNAFILPPELISERGRKKENVEKWDRIITKLIIFPWFTLYLIAGLDIRFGWTPELALWIHITCLVFFVFGNALVTWAMVSNIFFSTAVRIQYDRGQTVSNGGPYRYMRHPGYLGMIVYIMSTPLILGSIWAFIPAILMAFLFIIRTAFEDNTLKNRLEGYKEYAEKVKYRLIPDIW